MGVDGALEWPTSWGGGGLGGWAGWGPLGCWELNSMGSFPATWALQRVRGVETADTSGLRLHGLETERGWPQLPRLTHECGSRSGLPVLLGWGRVPEGEWLAPNQAFLGVWERAGKAGTAPGHVDLGRVWGRGEVGAQRERGGLSSARGAPASPCTHPTSRVRTWAGPRSWRRRVPRWA